MVEKIILLAKGASFDIVHNESTDENMKNNIEKSIFKNRWGCMKQHCVIMHTYINQIGPFKFRLCNDRIWGH